MTNTERCSWCGNDPLYVRYHDTVWGRPEYDDRALFEKLCLDGQQAGLSWITILRKQGTYREAYDDFDPEKIIQYDDEKVAQLLENPGIIRNRLKVQSVIKNARGYLKILEDEGSFSDFLWSFVNHSPIQNRWTSMSDVPVTTPESEAMSKALKRRGFTFVGPTIVYAFMQATGMVNDHLAQCPQHSACRELAL
ncbi:DNA-3-methyladenine glycosylase I [Marinobacter salinexigens]|uniref:DNA-3-methyladenine glycosylase I n=1 Tax=Marinobacter salinexigens TaxID=2919747 RepID=A0A5B0VJZ0_9GAMM|nr:DNA-3-methyladenine glycosylase I [Marinobacter salinexigens]KAA1174261.1 DNA-3-methyladenine glycosylase I [Marinobacter salinexigens]